MSEIVLYHNPRCSKSRAALELLQSRELAVSVVPYLETPPDAATLRALLAKLGLEARQLLRTGEDAYRELNLADPALDDAALIAAMAAHPKLIERPIAVRGERAVVGRPPERVLEILQ
ncbi:MULTISPECIES: arsenate reductase (glutaredoxin) [Pseudomonas]|uniref:arsenate reductase (glutaredoxin) n=1 Tax=Pseudomonas TaxID=286 RepID=UPI00023A1752|nr:MULTISPECIES: arsenate reductase (glutaredoxin) [Pseudomonas]EHK72198.1 arsenate reductase [Pseudomonas psychrotolerans L19]MBA1179435.1 arsenate reductase (glutaredoxin) [Pseudomonas psychrotolerans]MBA1210351.1 arsenate reductase (glutaredoxin) [Pseudomonas psychrotolerans]MBH3328439.1 arsenate reductase (glutaredoxin) [Pseudomonas oryzihabitans]RAU41920.1 arsenate reductase (glutaredoxin) [Pseudomonas sp. RIT 411]